MIPETATCSYLLGVPQNLTLHPAPLEQLVSEMSGPSNADWRGSAVLSICRDYGLLAPAADPKLRAIVRQTAATCTDWFSMNLSAQTALPRSLVGMTNLVLRVRGATSACATSPSASNVPAAQTLADIASSYTTPVTTNLNSFPATHSSAATPTSVWSERRQRPAMGQAQRGSGMGSWTAWPWAFDRLAVGNLARGG